MSNSQTRPPKPQSDAPTVMLHWGMVVTLIISLVTGLRIAADDKSGNLAHLVMSFLPQGPVISWHAWAAVALLSLSVAYVVFLWRAKIAQRVLLDRAVRSDLSEHHPPQRRWRAINISIYWLAFLAIFVAGVSGIVLYLVPGALPYDAVALVHQIVAWSLLVYIVLHIGAILMLGGLDQLLKLFRPRAAYGAAAFVSILGATATAAAFYGLDRNISPQLKVARISTPPTLDGRAMDPLWQKLPAVKVATARAANSPGGEVEITVKAAHDDTYFYALFQWPDSTRSQKHLPLVKTEAGWKVLETEFSRKDEDQYYEDKFAVMLAEGNGLAGDNSIHLGTKPLEGKPGPSGGRGLHYTTHGRIVDVWHWKSVRTGNRVMQQIDDNYFGPPKEPKGKGRYTGGYSKDPKTAGGFKMNWEKYSDDVVIPKRLPKDPALLEPFQEIDPNPKSGDAHALFMSMDDTVPYDPELDNYPVGTLMPAVLVEAPFSGDRGDVTAVSHWQNGVWTIETRRRLDTGSEYDTAISHDRPTYLWVAAFDHSQTRHSQHLHPVTLTLE